MINDATVTDPSILRLTIFLAVFATMLLWEGWHPFRQASESKLARLTRHLSLMGLNFLTLRVLSGGGAYAVAVLAEHRDWGLFAFGVLPPWFRFVSGLLALDFAIYAQHLLFHKVPWLWRLHKVHHSDLAFDTTTAIRFHPLEIVLSMFYKMLLVAGLGLSPLTVLSFEVLLNACAQFNHGNVRLPRRTEQVLQWLLITPDLHRIHHSTEHRETDSNFGFSVPWWDWWCGTYRAEPERGQSAMEIGLKEERDASRLGLAALLLMPFRLKPVRSD